MITFSEVGMNSLNSGLWIKAFLLFSYGYHDKGYGCTVSFVLAMSPLIRACRSSTFCYFVSVPSMLRLRASYTFLADSQATDFPDSGLGFTVLVVFFLSYFLLCRRQQRK